MSASFQIPAITEYFNHSE